MNLLRILAAGGLLGAFSLAPLTHAGITATIITYTTDELTFSVNGTLDAATIGSQPRYFAIKNDWSNNKGVRTTLFLSEPTLTFSSFAIDGVTALVGGDMENSYGHSFYFLDTGGTTPFPAGTTLSGTVTLSGTGAFDPVNINKLQFLSGLTSHSSGLDWARLEANFTYAPVPEPHEYALAIGMGLLGFGIYRRKFRTA